MYGDRGSPCRIPLKEGNNSWVFHFTRMEMEEVDTQEIIREMICGAKLRIARDCLMMKDHSRLSKAFSKSIEQKFSKLSFWFLKRMSGFLGYVYVFHSSSPRDEATLLRAYNFVQISPNLINDDFGNSFIDSGTEANGCRSMEEK